ncbi:DNA polymerase III subunit gamma and tau, partial [Streptomyces sp. NPDC060194]
AGTGPADAAPQRPGGWPTAPGRPAAPAPQGPAPQPTRPEAPAAPPSVVSGDTSQVRSMWPGILDAVKNRRRFTWILLSQNAQVAGFDGTTLQLGFINAGARDNFASSGSEEVLRQALSEQFHVQWKIEAIVDPTGGSAPPPAATGFGGSGGTGGYGNPAPAPRPAPAPAPAPQPYSPPPAAPAPHPTAPRPTADQPPRPPATEAYRAPEPVKDVRPPVSVEDDVPEDDDPDLDETALTGHELIVRELGATVVEEYTNE